MLRRRITLIAIIALLLQTIAVGGTYAADGPVNNDWTSILNGYVTVDPIAKDKLLEDGAEYRFASLNYPGGVADTPFAQEDAIRTIAAMGGKVTRVYVLSVKKYDNSNTETAHIQGPDENGIMQFNEESFRKLDHLLAVANQYGVRVILPFVDQWQWTGGIESYAAFRGYPISGDAANDPDAWNFYTDETIKSDFKQVINYTMNRVNTFTGVVYKDDPAILAWETGNELGGYHQERFPQAWTTEMAAYMKSQQPKQLVLDGRFAIHPDSLTNPDIDVVGNHFYTGNFIDKVNADRALSAGKKPYILGEFGLYTKAAPVNALFDAALQNGTSGALLWSLRPHKDDGGFYWHDEDPGNWSSYHWPGFSSGDWYDETNIIRTVYQYAHYMNANDPGKTTSVPPIKAPETTPVLFPIESVGNIKWRGSVGAAGYEVQRSENGTDWLTVASSFSDGGRAGTPTFHDEQAITGTSYQYRVRGVNESGHSQWSNVVQTTAKHVITDELSLLYNDVEKRKVYAYDHSGNLTTVADSWNELGIGYKAFVAGDEFGYLTYGSPVPIHTLTVKSLGSGIPQFMASSSNGGFVPVAEQNIGVSNDVEGKVYTLSNLPEGTRYVKLLVPGSSTLRIDRVDLEYRYNGEEGQYIPLEPIQRSGFVVDSEFGELPDDRSDNLVVEDGRLVSNDDETGYVLYRTGGDMNSYRIVSHGSNAAVSPLFETSLDGVHFAAVTPAVQHNVGGEDSGVSIYSHFAVKAGTRYLKIIIPSKENGEGASISRVEIGYGGNMIPLTDKPPVNVLEDAEYYFGKDEELKAAYVRNLNGDAIVTSITTEYKSNGSYGMKLDYDLGANQYAGLTNRLDAADLSTFDALQAWVKGDGSGNKLTFQFRLADGSVWEAVKLLQDTEGKTIQIKYDEFAQPSWDTPVSSMDMSAVREFSLYVSSDAAATAGSGSVYLDNIRVASSTKLDNYESYGGYDTLLQKAYSRNTGGGQFDVSLIGDYKSEGDFGLKLDYDVAAAGYAGATLVPNFLNLKGYDGFSMWFTPDDSRNKLVIQFTTEDGKYWETSTTIKGTDARLVYVPFSKFRHPGWYGGDPAATPDMSANIIAFSIYINKDEGVTRQAAGTVYLDDINGASFEDRLSEAAISITTDEEAVKTFPYTIRGTGPAHEYVAIAVGKQKFYAAVDAEGTWSYDIPRMVNGEERTITAAIELYDETVLESDSITVQVDVPGNTYQEEPEGGEEEPPVDPTNYVVNGGFETPAEEGVWPLLPKDWSHVDADGVPISDGKVKLEGNARTGSYKLVHYNGGPYEAVSSQTVAGLEAGIYEVTAWTQSKAGNPQLAEMIVSSGDAAQVVEAIEPGESSWTKQTITNIAVTNGALTLSFRSKNTAGDFWIGVDDVELIRIGELPDDGGDGGGGDNGGENNNGGNNGNNGGSGSGTLNPGTSNGLKAYTLAQLQDALKTGDGGLASNEAGVEIPAAITDLVGDGELTVKAASAELIIPSAVLEQLAGLVLAGELATAKIVIAMEKLPTSHFQPLLTTAGHERGADIAAAGAVYEWSLSIRTASGTIQRLTELAEPATVKLQKTVNTDVFTGIYYISEEGTVEYVGGRTEGGYTTAEVRHFSKYGVLSYNKTFRDVPAGHWVNAAVKVLAAKGIIEGVKLDEFRPGDEVTRAQFTAMLVRALGLQASEASAFKDVAADSWYAEAVAAAAEYGIVHGRSQSLFAPNATITREEMVVMLVRAYELREDRRAAWNAVDNMDLESIHDGEQISEWAKSAVQAAYSLGLVKGDARGSFKPQDYATRAHSAQLIYRLTA